MRPAHQPRRRPNSATAEGRRLRGATPTRPAVGTGRRQGGTPTNVKDPRSASRGPAARGVVGGYNSAANKATVSSGDGPRRLSPRPPKEQRSPKEVDQEQREDTDGPVIPPFPENPDENLENMGQDKARLSQDGAQGNVLGFLGRTKTPESQSRDYQSLLRRSPEGRRISDESFALPSPVSARLPSEAEGVSIDEETRLHCLDSRHEGNGISEGMSGDDGPCPDEALTNLGRMEALSRAMAERCERLEEELKTKDDALQELAARLESVGQPVSPMTAQALGRQPIPVQTAQTAKPASDPRPAASTYIDSSTPRVTPVMSGRQATATTMSPGRLGMNLPVTQVSPRAIRVAVTPRALTPPPGMQRAGIPMPVVQRHIRFGTPPPGVVPSQVSKFDANVATGVVPVSTTPPSTQQPLSPEPAPAQIPVGQAASAATSKTATPLRFSTPPPPPPPKPQPPLSPEPAPVSSAQVTITPVGAWDTPQSATSRGAGHASWQIDQQTAAFAGQVGRAQSVGAIKRTASPAVVRLVSDATSSVAGHHTVTRQQSAGNVVRQRSASPHTVVRMASTGYAQQLPSQVRIRDSSPHQYRPAFNFGGVRPVSSRGAQPLLAQPSLVGQIGGFRSGSHGQLVRMPGVQFQRTLSSHGPITVRGGLVLQRQMQAQSTQQQQEHQQQLGQQQEKKDQLPQQPPPPPPVQNLAHERAQSLETVPEPGHPPVQFFKSSGTASSEQVESLEQRVDRLSQCIDALDSVSARVDQLSQPATKEERVKS